MLGIDGTAELLCCCSEMLLHKPKRAEPRLLKSRSFKPDATGIAKRADIRQKGESCVYAKLKEGLWLIRSTGFMADTRLSHKADFRHHGE